MKQSKLWKTFANPNFYPQTLNIRPTTLSFSDSLALHKKEEKSEVEDEQENCTETRHVVKKVDTRDTANGGCIV